jgi:THO complex subunit 2
MLVRTKKHEPLKIKGARTPASTFEAFRTIVIRMLLALGPYSSDDPVLLYKVLRILKAALGISNGNSSITSSITCLYYDILTIMDEVFLPALALSEGNCCLAEEIWSILRIYPYHCRYRLYGQWKSGTYTQHPPLMRRKADIQKRSKAIMQRISKENVKPTSRKIGKVTNSSPVLVLFDYVLAQIQPYDNLIGPVVDSLKYLTSLSFDVLAYSIIEALSGPEKDRTKHDTTSISLWLQSLSNFCGAVYKKYNIELTGILQYVANQLKNKKSLDLLIL